MFRPSPALGSLLLLAIVLTVLSWSRPAAAYTWMIRHGYAGCTTCHADPSGGELLTAYGRVQSDLLLRMRYGKDEVGATSSDTSSGESFDDFDDFGDFDSDGSDKKAETPEKKPAKKAKAESEDAGPSPTAGFLWGLWDPPSWLLLGGAYRQATLYQNDQLRTFPMQADLYGQIRIGSFRAGGSIGAAKVKPGSPHARAAQVTTNQGNELNLISRTHWLGFDLGKGGEWTLRAGRLNLPFGVRIPEHTMWVREATRTDRESDQQHGVALAYNGQVIRTEVMGIAGNYQVNPDAYRERGYSGYLEVYVGAGAALGVSSMWTTAKYDRLTLEEERTSRGAHGAFLRAKLAKPIVLLAEADALHMSRHELGYVGFLQLDLEPVQGLHFGGTGEALDNGYEKKQSGVGGLDVPRAVGAGKPRLGGWLSVNWFFLPHLDVRVDAIARQQTNLALLAQLHAFL
jgi:hypothetical protein